MSELTLDPEDSKSEICVAVTDPRNENTYPKYFQGAAHNQKQRRFTKLHERTDNEP